MTKRDIVNGVKSDAFWRPALRSGCALLLLALLGWLWKASQWMERVEQRLRAAEEEIEDAAATARGHAVDADAHIDYQRASREFVTRREWAASLAQGEKRVDERLEALAAQLKRMNGRQEEIYRLLREE